MPPDLAERLGSALAGKYQVSEELGRGGMARVFLAREVKHDRLVALKVLRDDVAAIIGVERFEREIALAARLNHPHILPLFDSGDAGGFLYYVMPFIAGETLRRRLEREKQFPVREAVAIARDVAAALSHAHSHGVVHRDVKPENILLEDGRALIADFGIARALADVDERRLTESGLVPGTPAYMSPEQAAGDDVDGRSDVYALACVLFEMLTGDPPFRARTVQATLSKHALEPPPSVEVVRPTVGAPVAAAIRRALAKIPADRFPSATEFADALVAPVPVAVPGEVSSPAATGRRRAVAGLAVLAGVGAVLAYALWPQGPALDPNRVVVFPLVVTEPGPGSGPGWDVALAIGGALEHTEPLRWIDGWTHLPDSLRADMRRVTPDIMRRISRDRGARFYLEGAIRRGDGQAAVVLRLHDARGDSLVGQETERGPEGAALASLGFGAITRMLPRLLAPGRAVDLAPLADRAPGAIALSINGDQAYVRSRFADALEYYRRAVEEDSLLAFAAVKGAQAASWQNRYDEAGDLIAIAARHSALLPPKYRAFVGGWAFFLDGIADSALTTLRAALAIDPTWVEARMALGEVYYHLLPGEPDLGDRARAAFREVVGQDSLFVPALFHLAEMAVRSGDLDGADRLVRRVARVGPDSTWLRHLEIVRDCVRQGAGRFAWTAVAATYPEGTLHAARALSAGGAQLPCGEAGFRALLAHTGTDPALRWGALMGLQATLIAANRADEALAVLDSAQAAGSTGVYLLYVLNAAAGAPFEAKAREAAVLAERLTGEFFASAGVGTRWLLGVRSAQLGDTARVAGIVRSLRTDAARQGPAWLDDVGGILEAHAAARRGDRDTALALLARHLPRIPTTNLNWGITSPLAPERALLADLLHAAGRLEEAARVAESFDHQAAVVFLTYLPRSLTLRFRIATALGQQRRAAEHAARLRALGWSDSAHAVVGHTATADGGATLFPTGG